MRPIGVPDDIIEFDQSNDVLLARLGEIRSGIERLLHGVPEVSIVMPAFNEESSILKTLACLSRSSTPRSVEIIVVDNNSADGTAALARSAGALCIAEMQQGITPARNAGLAAARGKYILNADADTLYPPGWIEQMVRPLDNNNTAAVYGRFSFIPTAGTPRTVYFLYEYAADFMRWFNKTFREEAVNMYGFNSAFKRKEGLAVEGFNHPATANEDGWLALKLRNGGFGQLYYVRNREALVWTTDRRIQSDGGLLKGLRKRLLRIFYNRTEIRHDL